MIRMEPASLGGLTVIPGSTCVGGEIAPLELSSFRARLSEPLGGGSLFGGFVLAWDASTEIGATTNSPKKIAMVSAEMRNSGK